MIVWTRLRINVQAPGLHTVWTLQNHTLDTLSQLHPAFPSTTPLDLHSCRLTSMPAAAAAAGGCWRALVPPLRPFTSRAMRALLASAASSVAATAAPRLVMARPGAATSYSTCIEHSKCQAGLRECGRCRELLFRQTDSNFTRGQHSVLGLWHCAPQDAAWHLCAAAGRGQAQLAQD